MALLHPRAALLQNSGATLLWSFCGVWQDRCPKLQEIDFLGWEDIITLGLINFVKLV
jgi:hypothetical protein